MSSGLDPYSRSVRNRFCLFLVSGVIGGFLTFSALSYLAFSSSLAWIIAIIFGFIGGRWTTRLFGDWLDAKLSRPGDSEWRMAVCDKDGNPLH